MNQHDIPAGAVARVYRQLPPHLTPHYGAVIALAARPGEPSLQRRKDRAHVILSFKSLMPAAGFSSLGLAGRAIADGGSAWLALSKRG